MEKIKEYLEALDDGTLIQHYNTMCQLYDMDRYIFDNDEDFFNEMFGQDVIRAVHATQYGDYRYSDSYVVFNGYGNLDSFNYASDYIDTDELAEFIIDNPDAFDYDDDLMELLNEEEEEKE